MTTLDYLMLWAFLGLLLGWVLYVVFGQVTVRKLRKNPKTKNKLGFEFVSGWDIFNAAQAIAIPKKIQKILESNKLYFLYANSEAIRTHTNKFDKLLAVTFFWIFFGSGIFMIVLVVISNV